MSLSGIGASPGKARGMVRILDSRQDLRTVLQGDIIVARDATPYLLPALLRAGGVICERGGLTCHLAVLSREFAKPCIVGVEKAKETLSPGDFVEIDGVEGEIKLLSG